MRRFTLSLFLVMIIPALAFGQMKFEDYVRSIPSNMSGQTIFLKKTTEVEGDPFSSEGWMTGKFHRDGLETRTVKFRLNQYDGLIEVENNNEVMALDDAAVEWITVTTPAPMIFKNGFDTGRENGVDESSLFLVIHEGAVTILRRENIRLQKDVSSYGSATQLDKYSRSNVYYAVSDDGFKKIRLRERDILRLFPKNIHNSIKDYQKEKKLDYENEAQLAMILEYAESQNK